MWFFSFIYFKNFGWCSLALAGKAQVNNYRSIGLTIKTVYPKSLFAITKVVVYHSIL